mmetsp:Transcript_17139/g.36306  ORF Transcript_17139/g.36306 Transcript_17139/m.36306 type:complete len:332 (-) Transcript_17139:2592-3587(-)
MCRIIRQVQVAPPAPLPALPACDRAWAPHVPIVEHTNLLVMALPKALPNLLHIARRTLLAASDRKDDDLPESFPLAATAVALGPLCPATQPAVLGWWPSARMSGALLNLGHRRVAPFAAACWVLRNLPAADVLTAPTCCSAYAPLPPIAQHTVFRWPLPTPEGHWLMGIRVTRPGLSQRPRTPGTLAPPVNLHSAPALLNTIATGGTLAPHAPLRQHAVGALCARFVNIAKGGLLVLAMWGATTIVGHLRDLAHAESRAPIARGGAWRPFSPFTPLPIMAWPRIACVHVACCELELVPRGATLAACLRVRHNIPVPVLLAAATSFCAAAPR